jgi:peroxiredoxin
MKSAKFGVITLSLAYMLTAAGCANANSTGTSGPVDALHRFTLQDVKGNSVSLDAQLKAHKALLVNFWATWCPPCREEIPDLIKLYAKNKDRGLEILGVDVGESPTKVSNFIEKAGINYPVVLDRDMSVSETYRVVGIPTTYLMNSEGAILGEYHGYTPQLVSDVEKALK